MRTCEHLKKNDAIKPLKMQKKKPKRNYMWKVYVIVNQSGLDKSHISYQEDNND